MRKYDPTQLIINMNPSGHSGNPLPSFAEIDLRLDLPKGEALDRARRLASEPVSGAAPGALVSWDTWVQVGIQNWETRRPIRRDLTRYGIVLYADRGEGKSELHLENERMRGWRKPGLVVWSIDHGDFHCLWADENTGVPIFRLQHPKDELEAFFARFSEMPNLSPFLGWDPEPFMGAAETDAGIHIAYRLLDHPRNTQA